jgi:hypothetical protein
MINITFIAALEALRHPTSSLASYFQLSLRGRA